MLDIYQVSLVSFDTMAEGRSDPAIVQQLKLANRSRQMVLLRAVLDRAQKLDLRPWPSMDEAWTLLAYAQKLDEAATDQVIGLPRTGLWAANVLRRLRAGTSGDDDPPLWADLGYLHQMATAAAIRAGHDFQSRVPVWRGTVTLPTLGVADVRGSREWDFAQVHSEHGNVLIRGRMGSVQLPKNRAVDGAGWMALRTVRAEGCELWLDDIDPYRELGKPVSPQRLSAHELDRWTAGWRDTLRLLTESHPTTAVELTTGLTTLVPRAATDRFDTFSASHHDAFGSVVLIRPADTTKFAETLVHEFQHSKFGVLLTLVDMLDPAADNDTPRLYAPWRDDPRPPTGVFHGAFSFLGVTAFYRERYMLAAGSPDRAAQFEFAYRREQTARAVETLLTDATPSALGNRFLTTMLRRLREWSVDPLEEDVRVAAQRANLDNYLTWRLRHLRPPTAMVHDLTAAWLRQRPKPAVAPSESLLKPLPGKVVQARLNLVRTWLSNPELYDAYSAEPALAVTQVPGAKEADLALIGGRTATAAELYRQQILADPESSVAWAGFAVTSRNEALLRRPELVLAVHREIRSRSGAVTNPGRLAQWLS